MPNTADSHLIALEIRISEQSAELSELSEMVAEQWRLIDSLLRRVERMEPRLESLESERAPKSIADERPPHY